MEKEKHQTATEFVAWMSLVVWGIADVLAAVQIIAIYRGELLAAVYVLGLLYLAVLVAVDDWEEYEWAARVRVSAAGGVVVLVKIMIINALPLIPTEDRENWRECALFVLLIVVGWAAWVVLTSTPVRR